MVLSTSKPPFSTPTRVDGSPLPPPDPGPSVPCTLPRCPPPNKGVLHLTRCLLRLVVNLSSPTHPFSAPLMSKATPPLRLDPWLPVPLLPHLPTRGFSSRQYVSHVSSTSKPRFDLSTAHRGAKGYVETIIRWASLPVCKVVDVLRYPDAENSVDSEAYAAPRGLQCEAIPTTRLLWSWFWGF